MTLGFCHKVDENCTLLGYYAASSANLLLTCQDNLLVPSLGVQESKSQNETNYFSWRAGKKLPLHAA